MNQIIFLNDAPLHRQIRAARTLRGWRQSDLAYFAQERLKAMTGDDIERVTLQDIWAIENNLPLRQLRKAAVLAVLGLEDEKDL